MRGKQARPNIKCAEQERGNGHSRDHDGA
jgi:hypothetical protein